MPISKLPTGTFEIGIIYSDRNSPMGGEFWSDGYYVATIGEGGNWKIVENILEIKAKIQK